MPSIAFRDANKHQHRGGHEPSHSTDYPLILIRAACARRLADGMRCYIKNGSRQGEPRITRAGGTRPDASATNAAPNNSANGGFGAASGARRTVVVAIRPQDAMTMAAQAPRTCESRWRRTARAMGMARMALVANANAPARAPGSPDEVT